MFSNGHAADDVLDVDAAVAQRRPLLVRLGDLGLERDDTFESVVYLGHALGAPSSVWPGRRRPVARARGIVHPRCRGATPSPAGLRFGRMGDSTHDDTDIAALRGSTPRGGLDRGRPRARPLRRCSAAGSTRRSRRACTSPTRWWWPRSGRGRPALGADGAAQGRRRATASCSSPTPRRARAASWPANPALLPAVPVAPAASARSASRGRPRRCRARRSRRTSPRRPRGSRLGAWASHQSQRGRRRASELDARRTPRPSARFADDEEVPVPEEWGGYLVRARGRRVLAGPAGPDARPAGLPPRRAPAGAPSGSPPEPPTVGEIRL